jgi:hypothetical protein
LACVFVSYKHVDPDQTLAAQLAAVLAQRHTVFIDTQIPLGQEWAKWIDNSLDTADYVIALVSQQSVGSPMVVDDEISRAHQLQLERKRPAIIPVLVNFDGQLPSPLRGYVGRFQRAEWRRPSDTERLTQRILTALESTPAKPRPAAQRENMIARVRADWIDGVLDKSLYQVARIDLGLQAEPGAVERGIDALIQRPDEDPQLLAAGTRLIDVFDREFGRLLILGAPGSGKTTLLLELARDLLERAERDEEHPIPVVFNLSSWALKAGRLDDWMVEELRSRSDVPRKLAREWIDKDQVLPLLDGLDEVAEDRRQQCVDAINAYRDEHSAVDMVVCSRTAEYQSLAARLRLRAALVVEPLSATQVQCYVESAGEHLDAVRNALSSDGGMWELISTPLMLSIVALAYKDRSVESITQATGSLADRRQQVFSAYVEQMFRRRAKETRFGEEQMRTWLSFLGSRMVGRAQTIFQIEDVRSEWTGQKNLSRAAVVITAVMVSAFSAAVGWLSLILFNLASLRHSLGRSLVLDRSTRAFVILCTLIGLGLSFISSSSATPTESLQFRWPGNITFVKNLIGGALVGAVGAPLGAFAVALMAGDLKRVWSVIPGAVVVGALFGIVAFGLSELISGRTAGARLSPTLALQNSFQTSLAALVAGVIVSIPVCIFVRPVLARGGNLSTMFFAVDALPWLGFLAALPLGILFLFDHFVTRFLLHRKRLLPWELVPFLDAASERILLRRVGGGYIFVHRFLMEHFAKQWDLPLPHGSAPQARPQVTAAN